MTNVTRRKNALRIPHALLLAFVMLCLAQTGCGAKNTTAAKQPAPKGAYITTDEPNTVAALPATPPQESGMSAAQRMLASTGRLPADFSLQPEKGFSLNVPDSVGDGEPFVVSFKAQGAKSVSFHWRNKTMNLPAPSAADGSFQSMFSVALDEKRPSWPLTMTVTWENGKREVFTADIPVVKRKYPVQRLKVAQKFVTPPEEVLEKIKRDRAEMRAVIGKVSPKQYWQTPFSRPVPGRVSSLFGMRRVFNGVPKSPHRGVDFAEPSGRPIRAVEGGKVALVADHYYGGKTVVVDHGLGVFSVYLHMSAFSVHQGQEVARGQELGKIGSTGRVTGPHLHYSFYVLGESVNGASVIDM